MQVSADTGSDHEETGTAFALAEWVPPSGLRGQFVHDVHGPEDYRDLTYVNSCEDTIKLHRLWRGDDLAIARH